MCAATIDVLVQSTTNVSRLDENEYLETANTLVTTSAVDQV